MLKKMNFLHYLSDNTYKKICQKLNLDESDHKVGDNDINFPGKLICRVHPFNILYKTFGHIWFLSVDVNFEMSRNKYIDFEKELYGEYSKLFGQDVMADFPTYDGISCGYAEYYDEIAVDDADLVIGSMADSGCPPEQLDETKWPQYKKPHGTIGFCVSKIDGTQIKALARCHGTAMKKRIKDRKYHITTGISAAKIVNEQTEREIVDWLRKRHKIEPKKD